VSPSVRYECVTYVSGRSRPRPILERPRHILQERASGEDLRYEFKALASFAAFGLEFHHFGRQSDLVFRKATRSTSSSGTNWCGPDGKSHDQGFGSAGSQEERGCAIERREKIFWNARPGFHRACAAGQPFSRGSRGDSGILRSRGPGALDRLDEIGTAGS